MYFYCINILSFESKMPRSLSRSDCYSGTDIWDVQKILKGYTSLLLSKIIESIGTRNIFPLLVNRACTVYLNHSAEVFFNCLLKSQKKNIHISK